MYKFARTSAIVGHKGDTIHLYANSVWRADDPFVKANPDLFADAPDVIESSRGAEYRVEQATAAPGERRGGK